MIRLNAPKVENGSTLGAFEPIELVRKSSSWRTAGRRLPCGDDEPWIVRNIPEIEPILPGIG